MPAIAEFVIEVVGQIIVESIPWFFRRLGAAMRWLYFGRQFTYSEILKKKGNLAIWLCIFIPIFAIYGFYLALT